MTKPDVGIRPDLESAADAAAHRDLAGVSLILRDTHGKFLRQGSLSAKLPSPFPFQLHAPQGAMLQLVPGQDVPEVAIAA